MLALARSMCMIVQVLLVYYMSLTSQMAGVQTSLIASLIATNVLMTSLAFYVAFNEKLRANHFIGMGAIVVAILLLSMGNEKTAVILDSQEASLTPVIPICLSLSLGALIAFQCLVTRLAGDYGRMTPIQFTVDSMFLPNLVITILAIIKHLGDESYLG